MWHRLDKHTHTHTDTSRQTILIHCCSEPSVNHKMIYLFRDKHHTCSHSLALASSHKKTGTWADCLFSSYIVCMRVSVFLGEQKTSWEEDLDPPSSSKRAFCFSLPHNVSVSPPHAWWIGKMTKECWCTWGWIIRMSVSPTDVILSCEDILSRVVNSTESPRGTLPATVQKDPSLNQKEDWSLAKPKRLSFIQQRKEFNVSLSLSEETATKEVTAISTVFYSLQRYGTWTDKDVFIPNTHTYTERERDSNLFTTSTFLLSSEFTINVLFGLSEAPRLLLLKYYV